MSLRYWSILALAAVLSGCAQSGYAPPTSSSGSGITVYGDIDTSISRTR